MRSYHDHDAIRILVGDIATSWSAVEAYWYLIFTTLMPETPTAQVEAIYFSFETNAAQRQLVMNVAAATFPDRNGRKNQERIHLGQINAQTNDVAGRRNQAAHLLLAGTRATVGLNRKKPNKLAGDKDLIEELIVTRKSIEALSVNLRQFLGSRPQSNRVPKELIEELSSQLRLAPDQTSIRPSKKTRP